MKAKLVLAVTILTITNMPIFGYDCNDPLIMRQYIMIILKNIAPVGGCNDGYNICSISSRPVNGTYYLRRVEPAASDYPEKWYLASSDTSNSLSIRSPGFLGNNYCDIGAGLSILVIRERISKNTMAIFVSSRDNSEYGGANYFTAYEAPIESGCFDVNNVANQNTGCSCSQDWYLPPWTAGVGGTATVEELPFQDPLAMMHLFSNDWLKYGNGLMGDLNGDSHVDFLDLAEFASVYLGE